jgi:hypothetical protein
MKKRSFLEICALLLLSLSLLGNTINIQGKQFNLNPSMEKKERKSVGIQIEKSRGSNLEQYGVIYLPKPLRKDDPSLNNYLIQQVQFLFFFTTLTVLSAYLLARSKIFSSRT